MADLVRINRKGETIDSQLLIGKWVQLMDGDEPAISWRSSACLVTNMRKKSGDQYSVCFDYAVDESCYDEDGSDSWHASYDDSPITWFKILTPFEVLKFCNSECIGEFKDAHCKGDNIVTFTDFMSDDVEETPIEIPRIQKPLI